MLEVAKKSKIWKIKIKKNLKYVQKDEKGKNM